MRYRREREGECGWLVDYSWVVGNHARLPWKMVCMPTLWFSMYIWRIPTAKSLMIKHDRIWNVNANYTLGQWGNQSRGHVSWRIAKMKLFNHLLHLDWNGEKKIIFVHIVPSTSALLSPSSDTLHLSRDCTDAIWHCFVIPLFSAVFVLLAK